MNEVCPLCGRPMQRQSLSVRESAAAVLCAVLVLAACVLIYRLADHWLVLQIEDFTHHLVWREPLQSWDW